MKRRAFFMVGLATAATVMSVQPLAAAPPTTATGTAYVVARTITSIRQVGANTIITSVDTIVLTGTITGIATEPDVLVIRPDGAFTFRGEITGSVTIGGRSGTVVAGAVGTGRLGPPLTAEGRYHLLSGTGDLANLHLELISQQTGPIATYSGRYHFGIAAVEFSAREGSDVR